MACEYISKIEFPQLYVVKHCSWDLSSSTVIDLTDEDLYRSWVVLGMFLYLRA